MDMESKIRKNRGGLKQKMLRTDDPYMNVLMWATQFVIKELSSVPPPLMLMKKDFLACTKVKMQSHGYNKNLPKSFKFKHYSPMVFRSLRAKFGVTEDDIVRSISDAPPRNLSGNRSEMKFYVTYDHRYIIKTMTSEDVAQIHEILERYYKFVVERNGATLLPQYLDLFRITLDKPPGVYLIILRNIFSARLPIHQKFNLKGSEKSRKMSEKEPHKLKAQSDAPTDPLDTPSPAYRDLDFVKQKEKLFIGEQAKQAFMTKLSFDVRFLQDCNLMDYSLLLGIHDCQSARKGDSGIDPHQAFTDDVYLHGFEDSKVEESPEFDATFDYPTDEDGNPMGGMPGPNQSANYTGATTTGVDNGVALSASPMSTGGGDLGASGEDDTGDEVEGVYFDDGEVHAGAISERSDVGGSVPSLGELDLTEDVYAILSDPDKENREIYYIGLIDCLTHWGTRRKMTSTAKTVAKPTKPTTTANPDDYGERLINFMDAIIQ